MELKHDAFKLLLKAKRVSINDYQDNGLNVVLAFNFLNALLKKGYVVDDGDGYFLLRASEKEMLKYMYSLDIWIESYTKAELDEKLDEVNEKAVLVLAEIQMHSSGVRVEDITFEDEFPNKALNKFLVEHREEYIDNLLECGLIAYNEDRQLYFSRLEGRAIIYLFEALNRHMRAEIVRLRHMFGDESLEGSRTDFFERIRDLQTILARTQKKLRDLRWDVPTYGKDFNEEEEPKLYAQDEDDEDEYNEYDSEDAEEDDDEKDEDDFDFFGTEGIFFDFLNDDDDDEDDEDDEYYDDDEDDDDEEYDDEDDEDYDDDMDDDEEYNEDDDEYDSDEEYDLDEEYSIDEDDLDEDDDELYEDDDDSDNDD